MSACWQDADGKFASNQAAGSSLMVKPAGITRPATERTNRQAFPQVECLPKKGSIPNGDSEKTLHNVSSLEEKDASPPLFSV